MQTKHRVTQQATAAPIVVVLHQIVMVVLQITSVVQLVLQAQG